MSRLAKEQFLGKVDELQQIILTLDLLKHSSDDLDLLLFQLHKGKIRMPAMILFRME